MQRDTWLCQTCKRAGRLTEAKEVDHIIPLCKGGTDDPENLQSLCSPCHQDKTLSDAGSTQKVAIGPDGWPIR